MNIRELIEINNIKAKKQFGQNFLTDENILKNIVHSANIINKNVIEIGPGLGSLTKHLIKDAKKLICYEIDTDLVNILKDEFEENVEIVNADFLKLNLKKEIQKWFNDEEVVLVANLPYYITTPILMKVLEEAPQIKMIVVMMQKEVAERITGKPSTKEYNSLSVLVQYYMNAKILFNVSRQSFIPQPNVDSSVIELVRKKTLLPLIDEEFFHKFNRSIFIHRRKTLYNNIKSAFSYSKENIENIFKNNLLKLNVRSEELTILQITKLSNDFALLNKNMHKIE